MLKEINGWWVPEYDTLFTKKLLRKNSEKQLENPHYVAYEHKYRKYLLNMMSHKRTMLDVGSNIGTWSRCMCNHFDEVIAFEPSLLNIKAFKKNLSKYKNVKLIEKGLSDSVKSKVKFYLNPHNCGHIGIKKYKVDTQHKDDFYADITTIDKCNFKNVDLIKVDVEGEEFSVLKGAIKTIKRDKPFIIIERNDEFKKINQWITKLGFYSKIDSKRAIIYTPDSKII